MVFSSPPLFLDPPNWNQEGSNNAVINEVNDGQHLPPPTSMTERAKLAKIPQPEAALKCPRCDSTNTKFCYFNNYSLTQPRHFCKTCRRYWTRGGALRSVPVGGGCRRNKRGGNKTVSSTSKSSSSSSAVPAVTPPGVFRPAPPAFLAPPWHPHLPDYGFGGIQSAIDTSAAGEGVGLEQWRIQQFPFMGGLAESAAAMVPGMYPFEGNGKIIMSGMKMEEGSQSQDLTVNLPRQFFNMGRNIDGHEIWPGGGGDGGGGGGGGGDHGGRWVSGDQNLFGLSSSSTGNFYKR